MYTVGTILDGLSSEPREPGGSIRTINVSLLAMAALAAGYLLNRVRRPQLEPIEPRATTTTPQGELSLEKLRAAGF